MPRKKTRKPFQTKTKGIYQSAVGSDDETLYNKVNDDSDSEVDEVEKFHRRKEENLFKSSALNNKDFDEEDDIQDVEGIFDVDSEESEDEDEDEEQDDEDEPEFLKKNRFLIEQQKDEMGSDIDENEEDLPDDKAWGSKKSMFYDTDYVDRDFRRQAFEEEEEAEHEEEEAIAIQKRLMASLNEEDLGLKWFIGESETKSKKNKDKEGINEQEKVQIDVSSLSKKELADYLKKDSPELEPLIEDFIQYMTEARDRLLPFHKLIEVKKMPDNTLGASFIQTRFQIILHYCMNISFYMALKSKRIPIKNHPIIKQLLSFKKLLQEMDAIKESKGNQLDEEIEYVLSKLRIGEEVEFEQTGKPTEKRDNESQLKASKRVRFATGETDDESDDSFTEKVNEDDEKEGLEDANEDIEEDERRAITYEIAKNKGLTPKRKKELRNPRVKHKLKYKKALVRRKGQVRPPKKELVRYGGEAGGIRASTVKSIKFKY